MCRYYTVSWQDALGNEILDSPDFEFPTLEEEIALPTCTSEIGKDTPEGNIVWEAFCKRLRALVAEPYVGKIVIEVD